MKNVLIVDDAIFMRVMLKNIVSKAGYNVIGEAGNGAEAIEMYKELHPDLVFMDITMPEVGGIEAVRAIKGYDANAKIVMCSAMGQQTMVLDAIKSGASDFIVKPFNESKIIDTLHRFM